MTTSEPENLPHPLDLLEAYALNSLEDEESSQVEEHLDQCPVCSREVARFHRTVALLGQSVESSSPPIGIQARLMEALEPTAERTSARSGRWSGGTRPRTRLWVQAAKFTLPMAATVVLGLLTLTIVMNVRLSDRTDGLERENSTLAAQVVQTVDESSLISGRLHDLQVTSYWLANPENKPLALNPPNGTGVSRGILLVSDDGKRAIVLVSGMQEQSPSSSYQVWLMRRGNRVMAGTVKVDDGGWGTATIRPQEPLFGYDKVELVSEIVPGVASNPADMVLEAEIPNSKPTQMLILPPLY